MANQDNELRQCPTRIDGMGVLFAHKVNQGQCQDRQRGQYHKCFTCAYNNAYVAVNGMPQPAALNIETADANESVKVG
jgi:hypothetical protein